MDSTDAYEYTAERLKKYQAFSANTIETIAGFAKKQSAFTDYESFFNSIALTEPTLHTTASGKGVPVVDIAAREKPHRGVIVVHLPMANPLDANQLYHVGTVALTNPKYRVIAFGNPSGAPFRFKQQNLRFRERLGIVTLRNLRPLVDAELDYLKQNNLAEVHYVGYSYGAHKALIEASYTKPGKVRSLTLIDPVAHPRGLKQLIENFQNSFEPLGRYVDRTRAKTYFEARTEAARTKHHTTALWRPINISIGLMMARLDFMPFLEKLFEANPDMLAIVAWGSKSELGNDAHLTTRMHWLKFESPYKVKSIRLSEDMHALANDIYLYAAIIRESLAQTELRSYEPRQ